MLNFKNDSYSDAQNLFEVLLLFGFRLTFVVSQICIVGYNFPYSLDLSISQPFGRLVVESVLPIQFTVSSVRRVIAQRRARSASEQPKAGVDAVFRLTLLLRVWNSLLL